MPDDAATRYELDDAAADFVHIIDRVEHGEEITVCREGLPVAEVVPLDRRVRRRTGRGSLAGRLDMAVDRDDPTTNEVIARDFG